METAQRMVHEAAERAIRTKTARFWPNSLRRTTLQTRLFSAFAIRSVPSRCVSSSPYGDTLVSKTLTWSIESYVASTLAKTSTSEILANMVNAMLIYGDSAAAYLAK